MPELGKKRKLYLMELKILGGMIAIMQILKH
jgi:hypothetical protein